MGLSDALRKAASLLVEMPAEETPVDVPVTSEAVAELNSLLSDLEGNSPAARTVEQIVRQADGPNLDQIHLPSAGVPELGADGTLDFAALYRRAGLPETPFAAEDALEMLTQLPAELPLATRRQTVKVTLSAIGKSSGATPETIVADASRKVAALAACVESLKGDTATAVAGAEAEIAVVEQQIEALRQSIHQQQARLFQVTQVCEAESDRLDDVLEFFSLDVAPSRYAGAGGPGKAGG